MFPFGFGLSYTTFEYSDIALSKSEINDTDTLKVSFKIKNTGSVDGEEIAELYVTDKESTIFRPTHELKGFKKVFLKAGEEKTVEIELNKRAFAYYNVNIHDWHVESGDFTVSVGASSRDIRLSADVTVNSTLAATVPDYRKTAPSYYTADITSVPDSEFEAVLGNAIPDREVHAYPHLTISNSLEDAAEGKNGAKINKLLRKFVGSEGFAAAIALQSPIKVFISMSMGIFSTDAAERLIKILNDEAPYRRGIAAIIFTSIPKAIKGLPGLMKSL